MIFRPETDQIENDRNVFQSEVVRYLRPKPKTIYKRREEKDIEQVFYYGYLLGNTILVLEVMDHPGFANTTTFVAVHTLVAKYIDENGVCHDKDEVGQHGNGWLLREDYWTEVG